MENANVLARIAAEVGVGVHQVTAVDKLLAEGSTVPFIARYRKEATGSLEDEQLRVLEERLAYLRGLVKRQEEIIKAIDAQGKLTDELRTAIEGAAKLQELGDLYLPYKQKRRTRAQQAREQVCQRKGHQHAQQVSEKQPQGEHAGSDAQGTRRRPFPVEAAGFCPALLRLVCHGVPLFLFPYAFYALYG